MAEAGKVLDDETYEKVMAKAAERKAAKSDRPVAEKKLEIERTATGLYTVRYAGGGPLPEILKTAFTSVYKLKEAVVAHYGKDLTAE